MKYLNDFELVEELKTLVQQERELVTLTLRRLREVEQRKIYLDRAYPSLFEFCRKELGLSETETQTRISAMRLLRDLPEVEQQIENGRMSLTVAAKVGACLRREKIESLAQKRAIVEEVSGTSVRAAEKKIAALFPQEVRPEREREVSQEYTEIRFTANREMMQKFQALKELWSHKNYEGRYDKLFAEMADRCLKACAKTKPTNFQAVG